HRLGLLHALGGWRSSGSNRVADLCGVRIGEVGAEMLQPRQNLDRLEIGGRAARVQEAAGIEAVLFEEHERDAPLALVDELLAVPATRAARRRACCAVDAWNAAMSDAALGGTLEVSLGRLRCRR